MVPFGEAGSAAGRCRMLRDEHRMPTPRGLAAIVRRLRRCKALADEIAGMLPHNVDAAVFEIGAVLRAEAELGPERRLGQLGEYGVEIAHDFRNEKGRRI